METVAEQLLALAGDDRPGLRAEDEELSWAQVIAAGAARAAWLADRRGEGPFHVATLLDNSAEHALWLVGAALAGAVVVGGNPTHRGSDLARDLAHTECQLLVTDRAHLPLVDGLDLGPALGTVAAGNGRVLVSDDRSGDGSSGDGSSGDGGPSAYSGAAPPDTGVRPDSLGYLLFTSGTSGAPKACRCTQGRLAMIGAVLAERYQLGADACCYVAMPLFHSNALMAGWAPAVAGGATVALPSGGRFSASGFLPDVRRHGVTYFNYVGKPLAYILATPERPDDTENPLRSVFGNEGSPRDVDRFAVRFGCVVADNYGSTEGGLSVSRTPDTPTGALGPVPAGLRVLDAATGAECPPARFDAQGRLVNAEEAIGELVSSTGAAGFEGYWRNDEAEAARRHDGAYYTGDLGYVDDAGYVYFAGRGDDWLRVDGENFAAAPVARILERHPDVVLAAVYAVPDTVVGDQVMAALQLRPGTSFDGAAFARFLAAQSDLGTKWAPRYVRVAEALPTTATAKVLVRSLRAERWRGDDPMWWRDPARSGDGDAPYEPLSDSDADALDAAISAS